MSRYYSAEKLDADDFGVPFTKAVGEVVYDAKIKSGHWAMMTQTSFEKHGLGQLGVGRGQKYVRRENGELWKVEG